MTNTSEAQVQELSQPSCSAFVNPQPGDVVSKMVGKPPLHRRKYRIVVRRDGWNVYYHENHLHGKERCAWITTWEAWCKGARRESSFLNDSMRVSE